MGMFTLARNIWDKRSSHVLGVEQNRNRNRNRNRNGISCFLIPAVPEFWQEEYSTVMKMSREIFSCGFFIQKVKVTSWNQFRELQIFRIFSCRILVPALPESRNKKQKQETPFRQKVSVSVSVNPYVLVTLKILAAEWLRLIRSCTRLIANDFQCVANVLKFPKFLGQHSAHPWCTVSMFDEDY